MNLKFFTAVLVHLFILSIRRLNGNTLTQYVRTKYGKPALDNFRRIEKLSFRSKKLQKDIEFLNICKDYDVTPNFINFRVHNPEFVGTHTYRAWCSELLDREITRQRKQIPLTTEKLASNIESFKSKLSSFDFICINRLINHNLQNKLLKVDRTHSN